MVSSLRKLISFLPLPFLGLRQSEERRAGEIRMAMLNMLRLHGGQAVSRVAQRVQFAGEPEALWYLRQGLVAAPRRRRGPVDREDPRRRGSRSWRSGWG